MTSPTCQLDAELRRLRLETPEQEGFDMRLGAALEQAAVNYQPLVEDATALPPGLDPANQDPAIQDPAIRHAAAIDDATAETDPAKPETQPDSGASKDRSSRGGQVFPFPKRRAAVILAVAALFVSGAATATIGWPEVVDWLGGAPNEHPEVRTETARPLEVIRPQKVKRPTRPTRPSRLTAERPTKEQPETMRPERRELGRASSLPHQLVRPEHARPETPERLTLQDSTQRPERLEAPAMIERPDVLRPERETTGTRPSSAPETERPLPPPRPRVEGERKPAPERPTTGQLPRPSHPNERDHPTRPEDRRDLRPLPQHPSAPLPPPPPPRPELPLGR